VKPRFQADNDLRSSIRTGALRHEPSIDFQSALAARLDGIPDPEVLRLAMLQGRILISHDENSMPGHFSDFAMVGTAAPAPDRAAGSARGPGHRKHSARLDRIGSGRVV
jgi:hypothetical protein